MKIKCPECGSQRLTRYVEEVIHTSYDWDWSNEGKGEVESQLTIGAGCKDCGHEWEFSIEDRPEE
jgi:hypothetical protein